MAKKIATHGAADIGLKPQHLQFAKEYAVHGNASQAYCAAYPGAILKTGRINGCKLLKNPKVIRAIRDYAKEIKILVSAAAVEELKDKLVADVLTAERKKEILKDIAEGKTIYKELKPVFNNETQAWDPVPVRFSQPSLADRIRAIEVHNRMTGDTGPDEEKDANKNIEQVDFENMPTEMLVALDGYINHTENLSE